ncbi:MAG: alpha/beta hydrolase [Proteobacteria bacterium]|nr:alpha/beta hydrolase [Pseudomonadota bacterium]
MIEEVKITSAGLQLAGTVHTPEGLSAGEKRPAFIYLHGFGGYRGGKSQIWAAEQFSAWGYVTLRLDFRGCGDSEGLRGWVLPLEQVEDAQNAISYMASRDDVAPDRIALIGSSYGGAVSVYTAGIDKRVAAVISQGGWGDGANRSRTQHPTDADWQTFTDTLERGRKLKADTGETLMMHRYDIVPIPEHLRHNIDGPSIMEFPVDTPLATMEFRPKDVIADIAPRPILLLHAAGDGVTPANGSLELYGNAGNPTELHLLTGVDHFMFGEGSPRVTNLVKDWLDVYFPV